MSTPIEPPRALHHDRDALRDVGTDDLPLDTLFAELARETVDREPGLRDQLREAPSRDRLVLGAIGMVAVTVLALLVEGPRPDLGGPGTGRLLLGVLLVVMGGLFALGASLRGLDRPPTDAQRRAALGAGLLVPLLVAAIPGWWPGMSIPPELGWGPDIGCATGGLGIGSAVTFGVLVLQRADRPAPWRLATSAAAGASVGFAVQTLHCPANDWAHMVLSHGTVGLTVAAVTLGLGALLRLRGA